MAALTNSGAFGFTAFTGIHVAASANETLSFSTQNSDATWRIDAVSVAAVPEPASWAMLTIGFGMAGATLRRRRRSAAG